MRWKLSLFPPTNFATTAGRSFRRTTAGSRFDLHGIRKLAKVGLVESVRRVLHTETDKVTRAAKKPGEFRSFVDTFYPNHSGYVAIGDRSSLSSTLSRSLRLGVSPFLLSYGQKSRVRSI